MSRNNGRGHLEIPGEVRVNLKHVPGENANAVNFAMQGPAGAEWVIVGGIPSTIQLAAMMAPGVMANVEHMTAPDVIASRSMDLAEAIYAEYGKRMRAAQEAASQAAKNADTPGPIIQEP